MPTQNNYTKVYKTTDIGIYRQTKQPMEKLAPTIWNYYLR